MLDLNRRGRDVRAFVRGLERWIIGALDRFGVDMVLAPADAAVHGLLATEPGWEMVDKDKQAALYRRKPGVTTAAAR